MRRTARQACPLASLLGGCPGVTSLRPPWLLPKLTGHDVAVKPEGTALAPEWRV